MTASGRPDQIGYHVRSRDWPPKLTTLSVAEVYEILDGIAETPDIKAIPKPRLSPLGKENQPHIVVWTQLGVHKIQVFGPYETRQKACEDALRLIRYPGHLGADVIPIRRRLP